MANATITVLEADGVTQTDVVVLDVARQAAAASKSVTLSTEDKAVLDAIATSLALLDNVTQTTAAPTGADNALVVSIHPDSQNANGSASAANSAPVTASTEDVARVGIITETAPASDTASSGLNGRLQRIAQRITSMIALLPTALGAGGGLKVEPLTTEVHLGEVGGKTAVVAVTLSTDTSAYASGDLIADTQQIDAFFRKADGTGVINSINIIDEDNQGVALYVIFMSTSTSLGSENSAPNISDANLTAGFQGIVSVGTADYVTISGAKVATIKNIGLPVKAVSGTDDIYIAVLNATGTPTFTAAGLEMRIGVLLD